MAPSPGHQEMDLSARRGPTADQCRNRRADRAARRREPRLRVPADPGRAAQARSPGQRIHDPPGPQGAEDPSGAQAAHRHDMAAVPAHASRDDARHRLLPRGLRGHPPAPVLLLRDGDRLALRAHPRRDCQPGRAVDRTTDPQPSYGPRRSRRRLPVRGPRPGRAVHRGVRRSAGRGRDRSGEDPAPKPKSERLCGKVRADRPYRGHRPDADLSARPICG